MGGSVVAHLAVDGTASGGDEVGQRDGRRLIFVGFAERWPEGECAHAAVRGVREPVER